MPRKPKIEHVTKQFGVAHEREASWKSKKEKLRKKFFDLIVIPDDELARMTIYYEGQDPENYVATIYPKWRIVKSDGQLGEYRLLIEEDPAKKSFTYVNPLDGKVYQRTVRESAPAVDMERLKADDPALYNAVTVEPPKPERVLKPLSELDDDQKDELKEYLLPVTLTNAMEKPRKAKPEELE